MIYPGSYRVLDLEKRIEQGEKIKGFSHDLYTTDVFMLHDRGSYECIVDAYFAGVAAGYHIAKSGGVTKAKRKSRSV